MSKNIIYKAVGRSRLSFNGLKKVILEAETILNNRPLTYLEDETEQPTLTPTMILHGTSIVVPSDDIDPDSEFNSTTSTKLLRQIQSCKEQLWKRWHQEYLLALRERHQCIKTEQSEIKVGDVMQVKGEQKNRGEWRVGIVTKVIKIKDVVGAKLRLGTGTVLERPVQLLHPLELFSEQTQIVRTEKRRELENETIARPKRKAKTKAKERLTNINDKLMKDDFYRF